MSEKCRELSQMSRVNTHYIIFTLTLIDLTEYNGVVISIFIDLRSCNGELFSICESVQGAG